MKETIEQSVREWNRAADREQALGHTATAITFRNMAYLLEHPLPPAVIKSAFEQAQEYVANTVACS